MVHYLEVSLLLGCPELGDQELTRENVPGSEQDGRKAERETNGAMGEMCKAGRVFVRCKVIDIVVIKAISIFYVDFLKFYLQLPLT